MSNVSKSLVIPVNGFPSFNQDPVFEKVRQSLKDNAGKRWTEVLENKPQTTTYLKNKETTVAMDSIYFHPDRFEIVIDARGFRPEDLKCTISINGDVEVIAQRQETNSNLKRSMALSRNYKLPQNVKPEHGNCSLSAEGILLITAPWNK